jgi:hypothetical protein
MVPYNLTPPSMTKSITSMVRSTHYYPTYTSTTSRVRSFLTHTGRGSSRTEVGEDGEGTPTPMSAKLLVTTGEEAPDIALDLERGRARHCRGNDGFGFGRVRDELNKGAK